MARDVTGSVYESPKGSGNWHGKFPTPKGRKSVQLVTCRTKDEAKARRDFIASQLRRLRDAGRFEHAEKLLELAAKADAKGLDRVKRGVDAIVAGNFDKPDSSDSALDQGPTFKEFAGRWTSGELHDQYPDYVKVKRSVSDDIYRLNAHVYDVVGDVPLREFTARHAELVMRSLPPDLAPASRRHVAQLISRVLRLAAYPAGILERSPIPLGFLPRPAGLKADAFLYPSEDRALLAHVGIPLVHRLFYGFLDREGPRTSEAGLLTWGDVDLERGTVTLDENKTDDPRAWVLGTDVARALRRWKELTAPNAAASSFVFAYRGEHVGVEHLADTLRGHLARVEGIRPKLLENGPNRRRLRAHDLRATFVTLALATGKTETWVADRTGHKSSNMINRYRRAARTVAELNLGWLAPLDEAIPELRRTVYESSTGGSSSGEPAGAHPMNHRHSRPLATAGDGENAFRFRRGNP